VEKKKKNHLGVSSNSLTKYMMKNLFGFQSIFRHSCKLYFWRFEVKN